MMKPLRWSVLLIPFLLLAAGCRREVEVHGDYAMGEKVPVAALTYSVIESAWQTQLGELFNIRVPERRFLMLTVSVTNGGGQEVSVPLLEIEGSNGQRFRELDNGQGVDNWFGLLRNIAPAQTQQGRILFDVALGTYRLRLPDAADPSSERQAWVQIPLRMDTDTQVQMPLPSGFK